MQPPSSSFTRALRTHKMDKVCVKGKKLAARTYHPMKVFAQFGKEWNALVTSYTSGNYENSQSQITFLNQGLMRKQPTVKQEPNEGVNQPPGFPHFLLRQISIQQMNIKLTVLLTAQGKLNRVCRCVWGYECCVLMSAQPHGNQRSLLSVFFNHSPPYVVRKDLSLNPELTHLVRLDG